MIPLKGNSDPSVDPVYDTYLSLLEKGPCAGADPNGNQDAWQACKSVRRDVVAIGRASICKVWNDPLCGLVDC